MITTFLLPSFQYFQYFVLELYHCVTVMSSKGEMDGVKLTATNTKTKDLGATKCVTKHNKCSRQQHLSFNFKMMSFLYRFIHNSIPCV